MCSVRDLGASGTLLILQQEILALCDFLLDKASGDLYYIHKTGMIFAQITHDGFRWYCHFPEILGKIANSWYHPPSLAQRAEYASGGAAQAE